MSLKAGPDGYSRPQSFNLNPGARRDVRLFFLMEKYTKCPPVSQDIAYGSIHLRVLPAPRVAALLSVPIFFTVFMIL